MSYFPEISQRLAALSGSATPLEVRQALNEFDVRDINAVSVSEGSPPGPPAPGAVRMLDLGIVDAADLQDGPVTLYTPAAGELIGPVLLFDVTFADAEAIVIGRNEQLDADLLFPPLAAWDNDLSQDGAGIAGMHAAAGLGNAGIVPLTTGPVRAGFAGDVTSVLREIWQANHAYDGLVQIIGDDGHTWRSDADGGTSGGSIPNFAANEGGTVADNDITWTDRGALPTAGSAHVYAYVSIPDTP